MIDSLCMAAPGARKQLRLRMAAALAVLAIAAATKPAHATFPGVNGVIVFENPVTGMIGKTAPTGGAVTYLAAGQSPVTSPNGRKIVYVAGGNIHVMKIDGTGDARLTNSGFDSSPGWRLDGSLAFLRNQSELWAMKADGSSPTYIGELTTAPLTATDLSWGADLGELYAFSTSSTQIYTSASNVPFVTGGTGPTWAPDVRSVMYVNAGDLTAHERTADGAHDYLNPANGYSGRTVISPDGMLVAAGVGGSTATTQYLQTRKRWIGGAPLVSWQVPVRNPDWSRMPQNCYESTPQTGRGSPVAGDLDFYSGGCAIVDMPNAQPGSPNSTLKQLVAIGADLHVYHRVLKTDSFGNPGWTPFVLVPGYQNTATGMPGAKVAIAGAKDGSAQIVITNTDGGVWHTVRYPSGNWQPQGFLPVWTDNNRTKIFMARDVAIAINGDSATSPGNLQLIANDLGTGDLYHRIRFADASWSNFGQVPGGTGISTQQLAIAVDPSSGHTIVLASTRESSYSYIKRQIRYADGSWDSSFVTIPVQPGIALPPSTDIGLAFSGAGTAQLVYADSVGGVWYQVRTNVASQASWTGPVTNTSVVSSGCSAVSMAPTVPLSANSELMLTCSSPQLQ